MVYYFEFNSWIDEKKDSNSNWEELWGKNFQTSLDKSVVDWNKIFLNSNICVLEIITDIQYSWSESTHSDYRNVDTGGVIILYWNIWFIKVNALDTRTPTFTVSCNKFTCIRTVTFLNTCGKERMVNLCSTRELFDQHGSQKRVNIIVIVILCK